MSVEAKIKSEFAKIYSQNDWELFKVGANYYLRLAASLKNNDIILTDEEKMAVFCKDNRLLFRNIQKRLSIGIAGELILKAHFLREGYLINKPIDINQYRGTVHQINSIPIVNLNMDDSFTFDKLIQALPKLEKEIRNDNGYTVPPEITEGLKIAKVFRNKEAHVITNTHEYNKDDYSKIEACMKTIYSEWFGENLEFLISFEKNEDYKFEIE